MKKRPTTTITKYKIKQKEFRVSLFFFSMATGTYHRRQHWWLEGFAISLNGSGYWPNLGYFASYNFTKNFNPLLHRQRSAMLVEMQRKHQTHRHLPSFGKTLRNCHGLSSCRRPMGLTPELIVEDTGKGEIYELVSLQPSLCFRLYQYFLMPSQGGGGGEGVGSGVFSGEWRGQQVLNSVNDCRKWFVSLEVDPAQSQCPSQKLTCSSLKIDCAKHQGALGNLQPQFPRQGAPGKPWNAPLPAAALWTKPTLTAEGLLCKFSGFISAETNFC